MYLGGPQVISRGKVGTRTHTLGALGDRVAVGPPSGGIGRESLRFAKGSQSLPYRTGGLNLPKARYDITDFEVSDAQTMAKMGSDLWASETRRRIPGDFNRPYYTTEKQARELETGPGGELIINTDIFGASIFHDKFGTPIHKGVGAKDIVMFHKEAAAIGTANLMEKQMKPIGKEILKTINQIEWRMDRLNQLGASIQKPDFREIAENIYVMLNKSIATYVFPPAQVIFMASDKLLAELDLPLTSFDLTILSNPLTAWTWPIIKYGFKSKKQKKIEEMKSLIPEIQLLEAQLQSHIRNLNSMKAQYDKLMAAFQKGPDAIKVKMDTTNVPRRTVEVIEDVSPGIQRIKRVERAVKPASLSPNMQLMYFANEDSPVLARFKRSTEVAKDRAMQEQMQEGILAPLPETIVEPVVKKRMIYGGLLSQYPNTDEKLFQTAVMFAIAGLIAYKSLTLLK